MQKNPGKSRKTHYCHALWLSMACEELRVFGYFDQLTGYIKDLPSLLNDLLEKILTRLVKEDETNILKKVNETFRLFFHQSKMWKLSSC